MSTHKHTHDLQQHKHTHDLLQCYELKSFWSFGSGNKLVVEMVTDIWNIWQADFGGHLI
jgi:hypothetical protein